MDLISFCETIAQGLSERLFSLGSSYSIVSYVGALLTIGVIFVLRRRKVGIKPVRFLRSAFPERILGHPSTALDVRMYVFNLLMLAGAYGYVILSSAFWVQHARHAAEAMFGAPWFPGSPAWLVLIVTALVEVLAVDLGYWLGHYAMHRSETLWEFHKVHHSAEVMSPLTELRQHPVEMILIPNAIAPMIGISYAALGQLFGDAQPLSLLNVNVFLLVFFLTISHLRHSHVWLPFTGWLGHIIHSPAHHQIHHSTQPKHFGRNLGFSLAVWDWAFGTLWVPAKREHVEFGVDPAESQDFQTMEQSLLLPFVKAAGHIRRAASRFARPGASAR